MSFNPSTPITGAAVPGFTSPTYTLTTDTSPAANAKQYAITAVGGTQTGVDAHSVSKPFTLTAFRPERLKAMPAPNAVTGKYPTNRGSNKYRILTRKGVNAAADAPAMVIIETIITVPVGSDSYEPEDVKAAVSLHIGALYAQSGGLAQLTLDGLL